MPDPSNVKEIFAWYARLRQSRTSREDAWKRVKDQADKLLVHERTRLMALVRDWEIIEGHRYKPTRADDPFATAFNAPEGLQEMREQIKASRKSDHDTSQVAVPPAVLPPKPPTAPVPDSAMLECPVCETKNAPASLRCTKCHTLLPQTQDVRSQADKVALLELAATKKSEGITIKFEFPETTQEMQVTVHHDQMVIGRASAGGLMPPDIDLSPYAAQKKGVSRYHASLQRQGDTLVLMDLQSLNHTHINGQRLYPHEVRVLREGDELRFGQLSVRVRFPK